jgi:hypothetical protein
MMSGDLHTAVGVRAAFDKTLKVVTSRKRPKSAAQLCPPNQERFNDTHQVQKVYFSSDRKK